jgi:hypothetical protein
MKHLEMRILKEKKRVPLRFNQHKMSSRRMKMTTKKTVKKIFQ